MRITFPCLAQSHQLLHCLPIAASIAERHRHVDVHVAAASSTQLDFARKLIACHAPAARITFDQLPLGPGDGLRLAAGLGKSHFKQYTLLRNRRYFSSFDAVVTPERTSLFLRRIGVPVQLIWTRHGAGDRAIGFAKDVHQFDFVLMAGRKIEQRLLTAGLIRPGRYLSGVYAKFDWAQNAVREPLFDNGRRTVLYNPHFSPAVSSWPRFGRKVLDAFATSRRYNLIFAPHVRMFGPPAQSDYRPFEAYQDLPHIRIDLGSERCIDMSYTQQADLYLGDVSSQVAEFLCRPRPCVFLDAHNSAWRGDPNYRFWELGPVLNSTKGLEAQLDQAFDRHADHAAEQRRYVDETFELQPGPSATRGGDAIVEFLSRQSACAGQ